MSAIPLLASSIFVETSDNIRLLPALVSSRALLVDNVAGSQGFSFLGILNRPRKKRIPILKPQRKVNFY